MIELFNPEYDPKANTLKYDITAVNATSPSSDLPSEFGESTLVIDDEYGDVSIYQKEGLGGILYS